MVLGQGRQTWSDCASEWQPRQVTSGFVADIAAFLYSREAAVSMYGCLLPLVKQPVPVSFFSSASLQLRGYGPLMFSEDWTAAHGSGSHHQRPPVPTRPMGFWFSPDARGFLWFRLRHPDVTHKCNGASLLGCLTCNPSRPAARPTFLHDPCSKVVSTGQWRLDCRSWSCMVPSQANCLRRQLGDEQAALLLALWFVASLFWLCLALRSGLSDHALLGLRVLLSEVIGHTGSPAYAKGLQAGRWGLGAFSVSAGLLCLGDFLPVFGPSWEAYFRGASFCQLALITVTLLNLLVRQLYRPRSPGNSALRAVTGLTQPRVVLALSAVGHVATGPLTWAAPAKGHHPRQRGQPGCRTFGFSTIVAWFLAALCLPMPLHAMDLPPPVLDPASPTDDTLPAQVRLQAPIQANVGELLPGPCELRPAHPSPTEQADGFDEMLLEWPSRHSATGHNVHALLSEDVLRITHPPTHAVPPDPGLWLGVIVHAPHRQATQWAFHFSTPQPDLDDLLVRVLDLGPALYQGAYDTIVPVHPQRHAGYAMLLVYHSVLAHLGSSGQVPLMVDLSRVGGHYFSTTLPNGLMYEDFEEFVLPLIGAHIDEILVYAGDSREPCRPHAALPLEAGIVLTVLGSDMTLRPAHSISELFRPGAVWASFAQVPINVTTLAYCVYYRGARYLLFEWSYPGRTVHAAVCALLSQPPTAIAMRAFTAVQDLDVQGTACQAVVLVKEVPHQPLGVPRNCRRRDVFVLHDLRVIGARPYPTYTNSCTVHAPSVLAQASLSIPDYFEVQVAGGLTGWPDVQVSGSVLLTYNAACQAPAASMSDVEDDDDDAPQDGRDEDENAESSPGSRSDDDTTTLPGTSDPGLQEFDEERGRSRTPTHHQRLLGARHSDCTAATSFFCQVPCLRHTPPDELAVWILGALQPHKAMDPCCAIARQCKGPDHPSLVQALRHGMPRARVDQPWSPFGYREPAHPEPPNYLRYPPDIAPAQAQAAPFREVTFLVYTPDYLFETVTVELLFPATLATALWELTLNRAVDRRDLFPDLVPVRPQPTRAYATVLALPPWAGVTPHVVVFIECQRLNGAAYSVVVSAALRKEDLLVAAGFPAHAPFSVFVGDGPWALQAQQIVFLSTGDLVTIAPPDAFLGVGVSLFAMLQSTLGWDQRPELPNQHYPGFWVLTDTFPDRLPVDQARRLHLRQDVADLLDYVVSETTLRASMPRIVDHADRGRPTSAVIVATQQIPRPTRRPPTHYVLLLDLRPVFQGLEWQLLATNVIRRPALVAQVGAQCPPGYEVEVRGPPLQHDAQGAYFIVADGQVLVIEYVAAGPQEAVHHDVPVVAGEDSEADSPDPSDVDADTPPDVEMDIGTAEARPHAPMDRQAAWQRGVPGAGGLLFYQRPLFTLCLLAGYAPGVPATTPPNSPRRGMCQTIYPASRVAMWQGSTHKAAHTTGPAPLTTVLLAGQHIAIPRRSRVGHQSDACGREAIETRLATIPTPCRAARSSVGFANKGERIGPTLLELSLSQDPSPFFEARALLEVLFEHHAHDQEVAMIRATPAPMPGRESISLHLAIPPTPFQRSALELADIVPAHPRHGSSHTPTTDWLDNDLRPLLCCPRVPAEWKRSFAAMPLWHKQRPEASADRLIIFTDGSASGSAHDVAPASWAFAVWVQSQAQLYYLGSSTHLTAAPETPYHIGEQDDTALTGELLALGWATIWALEYGATISGLIEFRYDATSAGGGVFGDIRCPAATSGPHGPGLGAFVRQLRQALETRCLVQHAHVKGHSGCLGNELCDQLSKHTRRAPPTGPDRMLPLWPHLWWQHRLWQWGWMAHPSDATLPVLAALQTEATRLQALTTTPPVPRMGTQTVRQRATTLLYDVKVLTYNVLTLFDPEIPKGRATRQGQVGLLISGKRDVLKRQFLQQDVWLVGLQETRLPDNATLVDKDFWMYNASATDRGHGGCALWINKHHVYAKDNQTSYRVQAEHVVVTGFSPRHLQVQLAAPRLNLTILVVHAPRVAATSAEEVRAFWQARGRDLRQRPPEADFLLLCDANSHVGSVESTSVGTSGAETENAEGQLLVVFSPPPILPCIRANTGLGALQGRILPGIALTTSCCHKLGATFCPTHGCGMILKPCRLDRIICRLVCMCSFIRQRHRKAIPTPPERPSGLLEMSQRRPSISLSAVCSNVPPAHGGRQWMHITRDGPGTQPRQRKRFALRQLCSQPMSTSQAPPCTWCGRVEICGATCARRRWSSPVGCRWLLFVPSFYMPDAKSFRKSRSGALANG